MAFMAIQLCRSLPKFHSFISHFSSVRLITSMQTVEETIKAAVEAKTYEQIPDILTSLEEHGRNPNPFSFLSTFSQKHRIQIIDEMLQSFIPLRPRSRPRIAYNYLLSYTLQSLHPLPLALAILQRTLRSGCLPVPQMHLLLSSAWLHQLHRSQSVSDILLDMKSIGYHPDCGTCNYIISSLCAVDQLAEAIKVLKGMGGAGCIPDTETYGTVISSMCLARKTADAMEMIKQMVNKVGLAPRQGTVVKVVAALKANKEIWRATELIEYLERQGYLIDFESYELVVEGCLEYREYILAGKAVMKMTDRGFIPYIKVRQKLIEGLAGIGELKLACAVRQRFALLSS